MTKKKKKFLNFYYKNFFLDVPLSTAEIIQRCLSVNPFDAKFREANMQINCNDNLLQNSPPETTSFPISLPSMLKLPTFLSQSPGIFSNISVLTTDYGEICKSMDLKNVQVSFWLI